MQIITKCFDPIHQRLLLKRQQIKHFDLILDTVTHIALAGSLFKHNTSLLFTCTSGKLPFILKFPRFLKYRGGVYKLKGRKVSDSNLIHHSSFIRIIELFLTLYPVPRWHASSEMEQTE